MSIVEQGERVISFEMSILIEQTERSEACDRARMFWRRVRGASYRRISIMRILRAPGTNVLMCIYQHTSKPVRGPIHSCTLTIFRSTHEFLLELSILLLPGQTDLEQIQGVIPSLVIAIAVSNAQSKCVLRTSSSSLMNEGSQCLTISCYSTAVNFLIVKGLQVLFTGVTRLICTIGFDLLFREDGTNGLLPPKLCGLH